MPIHDQEANAAAKTRLIAALRGGQLIGMTGAGLSAWVGYPLWNGALHHLAELVTQITKDPRIGADVIAQNMDMLFCAQRLGQIIGNDAFADFITREFGPSGSPFSDVLLRFASLPLRHILTFNFDVSCETAHSAIAVPYRCMSSSSNESLVAFFREFNSAEGMKTIFHLHGKYDDPLAHIALTESGYQRLYSEGSLFEHHFKNLIISNSLLFVGFSFNDNDVTQMFYRTARQVRKQLDNRQVLYHHAIMGLSSKEEQRFDDGAVRRYMADRYLTDTVFYTVRDNPTDNEQHPHAEFSDLIAEITGALEIAVPVDLPAPGPIHDVVLVDDIQRMANMNQGFLRRINRGQDDV